MAKKVENEKLAKTFGTFEIVGKVKLGNKFYTEDTSMSGYVYRRLNFSVDVGGGNKPFVQAMGGFNPSNPMPINVFDKGIKTEIDWSDRFNESILKKVPNYVMHKVGLSKDDHGKVNFNEYLHLYDAIEEMAEQLEDGMVVKVIGNLKFQDYKDNTSVQKEIKSVYIVDVPESDFHATFKQGIVTTKDGFDTSLFKKEGIILLDAFVFDYEKEAEGNRPFKFRYTLDVEKFNNPDVFKKFVNNIIRPSDDKTTVYIEVSGEITESRNTRKTTMDDLSDEVKELIEMGLYSDEDVKDLLNQDIVEGEGERITRWDITSLNLKIDKETKKKTYIKEVDKYKMKDLVYVKKEDKVDLNEDLDEIEDDLEDLDLGDLDDDVDF